jgi:hypothetical protein
MISVNTPTAAEAFFGAPIHVYTRAQAIADGVLVDATVGDFADVTRQHFGDVHVAMTAALFELIKKAVENEKYCNDWLGVWHDIISMSWFGGFGFGKHGFKKHPNVCFNVIITGTGRRRYHMLKAVAHAGDNGEPCVTYMLPNED